jgi:hypothetical protein
VSIVQKLTSVLTPTLLNEFTFSYTTDHINLTNIGPWQRPAGMTMTGLFANGFGGKVPGIQISGGSAYGGGFGEDAGFIPWTNSNPTYTFRDNISKNMGKHNLQFGFYYAAGQKNEENSPDIQGFLTFDNTSAVTTGNAFADLLTGNIAEFSQTNKQIKYYNRYKIMEPYLQDDWHITPTLTLNVGLRMSLYGTYRERYKQAFNFDTSSYDAATAPTIDPATGAINGGDPFDGLVQCGGQGQPPGCMKGHLFNPAPRIGFAWDPTGSGKTAIRGGYGVFFEHTNGNESNSESLEGTPPLVQTPNQFNVVGYTNIGGAGLTFPLAVVSIPNQVTWPYIQQWHLDVQRQLPAGIVGTIAYVGSKGTHLTDIRNLNQLQALTAAQNPYAPGQPIVQNDCDTMTVNGVAVTGAAATNLAIACGADPNPLRTMFPGFSDITRIENASSSNYHSLQVSARRNTGPVILSLAYTYSHSIDDSSDRFDTNFVDSYNLARSRANSNFDERHNLQISYVYDLPFFRGNSLRDRLLGGWQTTGLISAQSGTPFTIVNGTDFGDNAGVGNGVGTGSYPDVVGDPRSLPGQKSFGDIVGPLLYNPAAFAVPTGLTFGNAGRNMLTLPFHTNVDMALFKHFKIDESRNVEFRWEVFNVFNHTQFNAIDNEFTGVDLNGSTFLHPTGAHNPRIMQLGLKFSF